MRTDTTLRPIPASRVAWAAMVSALMLLTGAFWVSGLVVPDAAQASTMAVDQCNGHGPAAQGATTAMKCTVSVVNTISGATTYSATTVTRLCTLGPCSAPNGTFTTDSISLVTSISQCNNSDNDAAHAISCTVKVTNNIGVNTSGAQQVSPASVHQCVGSAAGGVPHCQPASTTGTTVTQCNGSGNGGGGVVHCQVDPQSTLSAAVPITVSQCNGTGNVGGSSLTCTASILTNIKAFTAAAMPSATPTPTPTPTATATARATTQARAVLVSGGIGPTGGSDHTGLLTLVAALVLLCSVSALLYRRYAPAGLLARYLPQNLRARLARKH
jgi:hypothetical protein